jgi:uncharacterized membrane protein YccC
VSLTSVRSSLPLIAPPARAAVRVRNRWLDRFVGSDPGLNRFRSALQSVVSIGIILEAELLFVRFTHALQIQTHGATLPASEAAKVAGANHEYLVIAMLLGAIVGMISSFGVMDPTARGQLITMLFFPIPMVAALAFGIAIGGHRILALSSLAAVLAVGTYFRRFGPRGFVAGMLLFMGDFFGFFLHGAVTMGDLGWLTAEIGVGLAVAIAVRFALFYPRQGKAIERTQRSYRARARKLAQLALDQFDDPDHSERDARRLHHQLVRLNEAALMIDAQLGDPSAVAAGASGERLHQRLFDVELALSNIARFSEAMGRLDLPDNQRSQVRLALLDIVRGDAPGARDHAVQLINLLREIDVPAGEDRAVVVVPHRFAGSVIALSDAMADWIALGVADGGKGTFKPSVMLFGGWLPGSAQVSAAASVEAGSRWGDRIRLAPYTRTAIQMGVAVGAAIALGDLLSGRRFYWAVIAAFITFMGANNSGEQSRKALYRVGGTVIGIGIGSLVVNLVGQHTYWSITVILVALFFGFYLMRINYAFMTIGITVMVSQLYVQLDEFSNSLLLLRLEETAIGAAVAIVVVTFVLPLRTRRVMRIAMRNHVEAVGRLVDHSSGHLLGQDHGAGSTLRADARDVDASYQALVATAQPLRRSLFGSFDEDTGTVMRLAAASRHYSRNLVADVETAPCLDPDTRTDIERASATLHDSLTVVAGAVNGSRDVTYTRSSALFDRAERRLEAQAGLADEGQLAVRDLKLIDGAMDRLAEVMGLQRTDFDTAAA